MELTQAQLEHHRQRVLADIPSLHQQEFGRLSKNLLYGGDHLFIFIVCEHQLLRDELCDHIKKLLEPLKQIDTSIDLLANPPLSVDAFSFQVREFKNRVDLLHVFHAGTWLNTERWHALNPRRELLASEGPKRLCIWLSPEDIKTAISSAPDIWSWRAGQYEFISPPEHIKINDVLSRQYTNLTVPMSERVKRIALLNQAVQKLESQTNHSEDETKQSGNLYFERGDINFAIGELKKAEADFRRAIVIFEKISATQEIAATWKRVAYILVSKNRYEDALKILFEYVLPTADNDRSGLHSAYTYGLIADIYSYLNSHEEAYKIRLEKELPIFKSAQKELDYIQTQEKLTDYLIFLGKTDEAIKIYMNEIIPSYQKHSDKNREAILLFKIGRLYATKGQLDLALKVFTERCLPFFELVGDSYAVAMLQFCIAEIHSLKNEKPKAIALFKSCLAEFERMGLVADASRTQKALKTLLMSKPTHNKNSNRSIGPPFKRKFGLPGQ